VSAAFRVGPCEVRPAERRVLVAGEAAALGARAFVKRTRLLCPEPATVRHSGGDPLDAANWDCLAR
jgi:hypothetical protein